MGKLASAIGISEMTSPVFWRDVIAEVFCSALLLFSLTCNYIDYFPDFKITPTHAGLVMGLTVVAVVETFGHLGGAHMNPAITFTMICRRELSLIKGILYTISQCIGGALGSGLVYGLTSPDYRDNFQPFQPAETIGPIRGMFVEAVLTFTLCTVAQGVTDSRRPVKCNIPGIPIGFTVGLNIMIGMTYTGAAFNPIIALGPAIVSGNFRYNWVYWAGPYLGAFISVLIYSVLAYVGERYKTKDSSETADMEELAHLLHEIQTNKRKRHENNNSIEKVSSI